MMQEVSLRELPVFLGEQRRIIDYILPIEWVNPPGSLHTTRVTRWLIIFHSRTEESVEQLRMVL